MKKKYIFYILAFLIFLTAYIRLNMYEYRREGFTFIRINRITGSVSAKLINQKKWTSFEIKSDPSKTKNEKPKKAVPPNPFP